jgi:hypothetical protein
MFVEAADTHHVLYVAGQLVVKNNQSERVRVTKPLILWKINF